MLVRALTSFADETGRHSVGDVFPLAAGLAAVRIQAGIVERAATEGPETATRPAPEMAIPRKGRR